MENQKVKGMTDNQAAALLQAVKELVMVLDKEEAVQFLNRLLSTLRQEETAD